MTNIQKNIISLLMGSVFIYGFVWITNLMAASPTPDFIRELVEINPVYYANSLVLVLASIIATLALSLVRKGLGEFTMQNFLYFSLPILAFLLILATFFDLLLTTMMFAAIPALLTAFLFAQRQQQVRAD